MKIELDEYKNIRELLSGLFQFDTNEQFSQAAIAVTDEEILIYDDNAPSEVVDDKAIYHIKRRFKLDSIIIALDEQIKKNPHLSNMSRFSFLLDEDDDDEKDEQDIVFYYYLNEKKQAQVFINELKSLGVKIKKNKVDLSYSKI